MAVGNSAKPVRSRRTGEPIQALWSTGARRPARSTNHTPSEAARRLLRSATPTVSCQHPEIRSRIVRLRRVWVRVRETADGPSLVEVGGLDRADAQAGLGEDVADLAAKLVGDKDKVGAA